MGIKKDYLVPKPQTDLSSFKKEMETRLCACGCGVSFKVSKESKQIYRSYDCDKIKRNKNHRWKIGMNYMMNG